MSLKLMYITNKPAIAKIAENAGADIIFVDLEKIGKKERQGNIDSVKSDHEISDILMIKQVISKSRLLVRVNPIHQESKIEIDSVINNGADIVMLPMWKTVSEVRKFIDFVARRAKVMLLLETKEADEIINEVVKISGIDGIYIGLNDLHLSYEKKFMFELLADGTVERLCKTIENVGIQYGFGGVGRIGYGIVPAEHILCEHYRLKSSMVILSRSFCDMNKEKNIDAIRKDFFIGIRTIRLYEKLYKNFDKELFNENKRLVKNEINNVVNSMIENKN